MKCTQYFSFIKQRPDRAIIKSEWILDTIKKPVKTEVQSDGKDKEVEIYRRGWEILKSNPFRGRINRS